MAIKTFTSPRLKMYNSDGNNSIKVTNVNSAILMECAPVSLRFESPWFQITHKGPWITVTGQKEEIQFLYSEAKMDDGSTYGSPEELIEHFKIMAGK